MMTETDRAALIEYRMQQATETVDMAKFLLNSNALLVAVNRIYYGMYYALTALALQNKFETSKHGQLIGWFNKEFIATKKLNPRLGKILRNAYQNRAKGDYDAFVVFDSGAVEIMIDEMIDFIQEIKKIL